MKKMVSVVVPVYNEETNVPLLANAIREALAPLERYAFECLFVNDGSTDDTRKAIAGVTAEDNRFRGLHLVENRGQSAAVVAGLRRAQGAFLLTIDGDLQNDPADFPRILELLETCDCVFGVRTKRKDTWTKRKASKIANAVRGAVLGDTIHDGGCGIKGLRRKCLEQVIAFNGVHRFMGTLMQSAGYCVKECEVSHHPREHGISKYGINDRLWRGIYDLFGVRWLKKRIVVYRVEGEE